MTCIFDNALFDNSIFHVCPSILGAGGGKKQNKRYRTYNAHEQAARALAEVREQKIKKILAERKQAREVPKRGGKVDEAHVVSAGTQEAGKPILFAGGQPGLPIFPPIAIKLGEIAPELAELKAQLESIAIDLEEDRRRRLLLLAS